MKKGLFIFVLCCVGCLYAINTVDDNRLVMVDYYREGNMYVTERGGIKVKMNGTNSLVETFIVYYPDGRKGIYGLPVEDGIQAA